MRRADITNILLRTATRLGIDRAVFYGILTRAWQFLAAPVTLLLIASRFSPEQQGFHYTMGSLLALQVFFELGLLQVIAQFASHEFIHLRWSAGGRIEGDPIAKARFQDLLAKSLKWFGLASILLTILLVPGGILFLGMKHGFSVSFFWRAPWCVAVLGISLNLLVIPFLAVIAGSGEVEAVYRCEMISAIVGSLLSWTVIFINGGLFATAATTAGSLLVTARFLFRDKPVLFGSIWQIVTGKAEAYSIKEQISWRREVLPMQWRMALSFASSYFLYQIFNPILFHFQGPVVAGQMGMTLTVGTGVFAGAMTWMVSRAPELAKLVAKKEWSELDRQFRYYSFLSTSFAVGASIFVVIAIYAINLLKMSIALRFVPPAEAALVMASICLLTKINTYGVYLRAHKKEPLMKMTVIVAVIQSSLAFYFGREYSSLGVSASFFLTNAVLMLPATYYIWKKSRIEWHT